VLLACPLGSLSAADAAVFLFCLLASFNDTKSRFGLKLNLQVVQKETEESIEMDSSMDFCGISSTTFTLGVFSPTNPIRKFAQSIVHGKVYYWGVCLTSLAATIVPMLKGKVEGFDDLDATMTCIFGACMIVEMLLKSVADGFLWVMPTLAQTEPNSAAVAPEDANQDSEEQANTVACEPNPLELEAKNRSEKPHRSLWDAVSASSKYFSQDPPAADWSGIIGTGASTDSGTGTGTGTCTEVNENEVTSGMPTPRKLKTTNLDAIKESYSAADKVCTLLQHRD
jgi:hypothetical protein